MARAFTGTLTLTNANQNYRLADLIEAAMPGAAKNYCDVTVTADKANANDVLYGGGDLSAANYAGFLAAGDSDRDGPTVVNNITTTNKFFRSAGAGQKIHFDGRVG